MRLRFAAPLLFAVLAGCNTPPADTATVVKQMSQHMLADYQHWASASAALASSAQALCQQNGSLTASQQTWRETFNAWAALQPALIGPLAEQNRSWQVQFWPDKKNLVGRQVKMLLDANPTIDQAKLDKSSVVLQGLSAAEYLLFDQSIDLSQAEQQTRYCGLLLAIGGHQTQLSQDMLSAWQGAQGFAATLSNTPNQRFAEPQESLAELLRTQVSSLELMKKKLGTAIGRLSKGIAQPYQAEAWRADASLDSLRASLASLQTFWGQAQQVGLRDLVSDAALRERIEHQHAQTHDTFAAFTSGLQSLLSNSDDQQRLDKAYLELAELQRLYEKDLARALNIQMGFNAHDGD